MKISPNLQIIVGAIVAILTVLANGTVNMPMGIPPEWGAYFVSWDKFLLEIYSVAAPIMLSFSSSAPGPLAPPDSPIVVAAQKLADLPPSAPTGDIVAAKSAVNAAVSTH